jgi:subtilisin family serine protease
MPIRTVPGGDERDEDVALAIRYAVDNGAKVINMSFGKSYSPNKELVYDAMEYAQDNDVLMVHAAGNDGTNNDEEGNYPDGTMGKRKSTNGFITVAANSTEPDSAFITGFSNYGNKGVDILAPGMGILSLKPDSATKIASGTSMAAPVVSGVATVLRGAYPELSAKKINKLIVKTLNEYKNLMVSTGDEKQKLKKVVRYPGIPSLYKALERGERKYGE